MRAEVLVLSFNSEGHGDVVTVEDGDEFAPGLPDTPVPGINDAFVLLIVQKPDAPVAAAFNDCPAVIGRTVLADQQFEICERLGNDAVGRFLYPGGDVFRSAVSLVGKECVRLCRFGW